jgi:hypothetical protein
MISRKVIKNRNSKIKSKKLINKKILKGGANVASIFSQLGNTVFNLTGLFDSSISLDNKIVINLNDIRSKINEKYINFLDSSNRHKLDTKITDSEYYINNPKNTFESLINNKWLYKDNLSKGFDDISNFNLYLVDVHGETKKNTFTIPNNICVVLLSDTNNLGSYSQYTINSIFDLISNNAINFVNKRSSYHFNYDEYENVMKMATWYYPSQECYDINLSINDKDHIKFVYSFRNGKQFKHKFVDFLDDNETEIGLKDFTNHISSTLIDKNSIIFLTCCRATDAIDFNFYKEILELDYVNRITNYAIEYYISNCENDYKNYSSQDEGYLNLIKGSNRIFKPKTGLKPILIENLSYANYLYFKDKTYIDNYINSLHSLKNNNLSTCIPYLYYFYNKLENFGTDNNKLDDKYTFDHLIFHKLSINKQIKFIEEIINRNKIEYNVFKKLTSICGLNFVKNLKEDFFISYNKFNFLDQIERNDFVFRNKDYINSYQYYHFNKIGKLLIYYSMEHNKIASSLFEQLSSSGLLNNLYSNDSLLEIVIDTQEEFDDFRTKVISKKTQIYNLTIRDIQESVMLDSQFTELEKLKIINITYIDIHSLPKLEYLRLEKIKDNNWSNILSVYNFNNLTKLELISLQNENNSDLILNLNSLNYLCIEDIKLKDNKKILSLVSSVRYLFLINLKSDIQFIGFNNHLITELYIDNVLEFTKNNNLFIKNAIKSINIKRLTILNMEFKYELELNRLNIYNLEIKNCKNIKLTEIKTFNNMRNLILYDCPDLELKLDSNLFYKIKNKNLIVEYKNINFITDKNYENKLTIIKQENGSTRLLP